MAGAIFQICSGASYIRRSAINDVLSYWLGYPTPIITSLSACLCEVVPTLFILLSLPQVFSVIQVLGFRPTCFPTFIHTFRLTATRIIQAAPLLSYHTYISFFLFLISRLWFSIQFIPSLYYISVFLLVKTQHISVLFHTKFPQPNNKTIQGRVYFA